MSMDAAIKKRSFRWLNITQFFGALNDNVFRFTVIFLLLRTRPETDRAIIVGLASLAFVAPFLFFSHAAGVLADKLSKRSVIVFSKWFELVIMAIGCVGVYTESPLLLYGLIFLMCTQSTIFGPSKYGIIPELVPEEDLSKANGYMTGLTYLAIIMGTFIPTLIVDVIWPGHYLAVALLCLTVSVAGLVSCLNIVKTPAVASGKQFSLLFPVKIFETLFSLRSNRHLMLAVLGSVYFLFLGGFIQQGLIIYATDTLGIIADKSGYLFPAAAIGIGIGALMAGKASGRNIEFGLVPIGAMILTVCNISLFFIRPGIPPADATILVFLSHVYPLLIVLFFLGIGSGLFVVPLSAFIQYKSPKNRLGEILACSNFFSFLGVAFASGLIMLFSKVFHLTPSECFLIGGVLTGVLAIVAVIVLPDFLVRFVVVFITKIFYRVNAKGLENVPVEGPALLVSNHVTWVDALVLSARLQRRVRFIMERKIYKKFWLNPVFRLMKVIPISPKDPPRDIVASLKKAREAMDDGYLVCIFGEGALTRNGNMCDFKSGLEKIVKGTDYPIVPVYIGNAWGSILSYYYISVFSKFPEKIPYDMTIIYGKPLPANTKAVAVRQAVLELSVESFNLKKDKQRSLPRRFIKVARLYWFRRAVSDTSGKKLSFGKTLAGSIALAKEIKKMVGDQEKVGVLLPSSVAGVLTNVAINILGKVPVNLNFTASENAVKSAIEQCEIKTVISSRAFMEKLDGFVIPEGTEYLEDIMPRISGGDKLAALFKAVFFPIPLLVPSSKAGPDDLATIIFSSGSTAEPKGVMLSHHNIISNIEAFALLYRFTMSDKMCGVLPFFHSFGYTVTMWGPLVDGFSAHYHPNPVDGAKIAETIRENKLTTLLATPTFLLAYIRRGKKEDFATLRAVIVGAEKLKKKVSDIFEEKFGLRPYEGYGATELAPVAAVNIPDATVAGVTQVGNKEGSVGHPVLGVVMKIVDPDTGEAKAVDEEGLLMVKGPNVMLGYLNNKEKTDEVLLDGWYSTGDIARMDKDGFVFLLDRLTRFSKIAGEMVPHLAIEEKLTQALSSIEPVLFVTGAPDEKKGEKLVVLYTEGAGDLEKLQDAIQESDLPNLWKPRKDAYFKIDSMPTLGSGKLDLKTLKNKARECVEGS